METSKQRQNKRARSASSLFPTLQASEAHDGLFASMQRHAEPLDGVAGRS
jgi:hypothetical protein